MASLDVFHQDAFSTIQLTAAVDKYPYQPVGLGDLDIFEDEPIRNTVLAVEQRQGQLILIPTTPRGAEGTQRITEQRNARYFKVPRLMHADTIYANEIQDIRAFGTESELMQLQAELARRVSGPTGILRNIEYTWEFHRVGAVQGLLLDASGSVIYNFFDEFGITPATEVPFDLPAGTPNSIRPICNGIRRAMMRKAQGAWLPTTKIYAMCGDQFYDDFVNHPDVIRTFLNWSAAADLRDDAQGAAFDTFKFAGIYWMNYRGSDDNTTIKIADDKVKFFPVGAPGVFRRALAPGESFEWVNTPGKPMYMIPIMDRDRNAWWKVEGYSYPLHICTRPEMLQSGRLET